MVICSGFLPSCLECLLRLSVFSTYIHSTSSLFTPWKPLMTKQQVLVYLRVVGSNLAPQDRGWCPGLTQLVTSRLRHGTGRHWQFTWSWSPSTPSPLVLLLLAGMVDSWWWLVRKARFCWWRKDCG